MPKSIVGILFTSKMGGREIRKKLKREQSKRERPGIGVNSFKAIQKGKIDKEFYLVRNSVIRYITGNSVPSTRLLVLMKFSYKMFLYKMFSWKHIFTFTLFFRT